MRGPCLVVLLSCTLLPGTAGAMRASQSSSPGTLGVSAVPFGAMAAGTLRITSSWTGQLQNAGPNRDISATQTFRDETVMHFGALTRNAGSPGVYHVVAQTLDVALHATVTSHGKCTVHDDFTSHGVRQSPKGNYVIVRAVEPGNPNTRYLISIFHETGILYTSHLTGPPGCTGSEKPAHSVNAARYLFLTKGHALRGSAQLIGLADGAFADIQRGTLGKVVAALKAHGPVWTPGFIFNGVVPIDATGKRTSIVYSLPLP